MNILKRKMCLIKFSPDISMKYLNNVTRLAKFVQTF